MTYSIVVAYDDKRGIAKDGKIPWALPEDLKWFKRLTLNATVIMGRKTWDSLPVKPLPKRMNFVISKSGIHLMGEIPPWELREDNVYIIGGAQIYKHYLDRDMIKTVFGTEVKGDFGCDLHFPLLNGFYEVRVIEETDF